MFTNSSKVSVIIALAILFSASATAAQTYSADWKSLDSRPTPQWFLDAKFGIFIHWGVYSVPAWGPEKAYAEWYWRHAFNDDGSLQDNEWGNFHKANHGDDFPYPAFARMFTCELFDPDEWADIFARSGAKYVVLTSKHHEGFCLWPSKHANKTWGTPWNSFDTGPRRDLLGDLTKAVRAKNLEMGIYYSLYEWFNPLWKVDRERYVAEHMEPQFKDVVTRYHPSLIFSDGEWDMPDTAWKSPRLLAWLFNESPSKNDVVVNDRWGKDIRHKHGGYYTTEYGAGLKDSSHPWEENRGIGNSFGYNRNEPLSNYKTSQALVLMLIDLVSRGGNLLLDVGPTADGRIPLIMQSRLIEIGQWLQVNGEAIYATTPWEKNSQWSQGKIPDQEYKEYKADYDIMKHIGPSKDGRAVIQAFFTKKGDTLYAITPGFPEKELSLRTIVPKEDAAIQILGIDQDLAWTLDNETLTIDLSRITPDMLPCLWAYAFKIPLKPPTPRPETREPEKEKPKEEDIEDKLEKALIDRLGNLLKK